ncbi:hypothetical protein SAZ_05965 [Streptomyces noursei ZPM]|nr:hypothetical protein SAZ_05965 [Streptomyces noursei ZPM]EOT03738.1 hypothetical protein K530_12077 [Streptomyces noursei CCRC 11814]EXU92904.1 hypothetical protein P354_00700 [Streptomyces noursei PD-1]
MGHRPHVRPPRRPAAGPSSRRAEYGPAPEEEAGRQIEHTAVQAEAETEAMTGPSVSATDLLTSWRAVMPSWSDTSWRVVMP